MAYSAYGKKGCNLANRSNFVKLYPRTNIHALQNVFTNGGTSNKLKYIRRVAVLYIRLRSICVSYILPLDQNMNANNH